MVANYRDALAPSVRLAYNTNSAINGAIITDDYTIRDLDSKSCMYLEAAAYHSA
jgi:fumarylacetoacetate (FAA) hydrolase family protein